MYLTSDITPTSFSFFKIILSYFYKKNKNRDKKNNQSIKWSAYVKPVNCLESVRRIRTEIKKKNYQSVKWSAYVKPYVKPVNCLESVKRPDTNIPLK